MTVFKPGYLKASHPLLSLLRLECLHKTSNDQHFKVRGPQRFLCHFLGPRIVQLTWNRLKYRLASFRFSSIGQDPPRLVLCMVSDLWSLITPIAVCLFHQCKIFHMPNNLFHGRYPWSALPCPFSAFKTLTLWQLMLTFDAETCCAWCSVENIYEFAFCHTCYFGKFTYFTVFEIAFFRGSMVVRLGRSIRVISVLYRSCQSNPHIDKNRSPSGYSWLL